MFGHFPVSHTYETILKFKLSISIFQEKTEKLFFLNV